MAAVSLFEVLISIVIIAILAVLSSGVFGKVSRMNQRVKCMNHLRSVAALLQIKARDHQGRLDHVYGGSFGENSTLKPRAGHWTSQLRNAGYITNGVLQSLVCQGAPLNPDKENASDSHFGLNMADPYGELIKDNAGGSAKLYTINLATHPNPGSAIFMADSLDKNGFQRVRIYQGKDFPNGAIHTRHEGRANVVFVDGHGEAADPDRLRTLGTPGIYDEKGEAMPLANTTVQ